MVLWYEIMTSYLRNYWKKIQDTRKFAREKNSIWILPVFDALVISVLFSWQLSVGTWIVLGNLSTANVFSESYIKFLWESSTYFFLMYFGILCLTVLDKIIVIFIHMHAFLNNLTYKAINKIDMWLWRKTGKDSVIATAMLKFQVKFQSLSLKKRRAIVLIAGMFLMLFYAHRLIGLQ